MLVKNTLHGLLERCIRDEQAPSSHFAVPGGSVDVRAPGVFALTPDSAGAGAPATLLSVGVHGDETAPIELLLELASELDAGTFLLGAPALLIVGHPPAIVARQRYLETNLNRLFYRDSAMPTGGMLEHTRAAELMAAVDAFWGEYGPASTCLSSTDSATPLHLDMHTAIRASRYPRFAVEPFSSTATPAPVWRALAGADLQAVLHQHSHSWTFSHYSRHYHRVTAFTLELGRVAPFGGNDLDALAPMGRLLSARLAGQMPEPAPASRMMFFRVVKELMRKGADFKLAFAADTPNFTCFDVGQLIARDPGHGDTWVEDEPLYVVFPNAAVELGARAALLARPAVG